MPNLNEEQFSGQERLFDPGEPEIKYPHQQTREQFFRDPRTVFHATRSPEWLPEGVEPIHTGTVGAALDVSSDVSSTQRNKIYGMRLVGNVDDSEVLSDDDANRVAAQWADDLQDPLLSHYRSASQERKYVEEQAQQTASRPYINAIEDPGSTSWVSPTTKYHVRRHEDFVDQAVELGLDVPERVRMENELAKKRPPTERDVRAEWGHLDWANQGDAYDVGPRLWAARSNPLPPTAGDARTWWVRQAPYSSSSSTTKALDKNIQAKTSKEVK